MATLTPVTFNAPSTFVIPSFWEELYNLKLNVYKLISSDENLTVSYTCSDGIHPESFVFDLLSFESQSKFPNRSQSQFGGKITAYGCLINVNTVGVS